MAKKRLCLHCSRAINFKCDSRIKVHPRCRDEHNRKRISSVNRARYKSDEKYRKDKAKNLIEWRENNRKRNNELARNYYARNSRKLIAKSMREMSEIRILARAMRSIIRQSGRTVDQFLKEAGYAA